MKSSPIKLKQKLSPAAAKRKAERDKKAAMTKYRKNAKAHSQRERRRKSSIFLKGKDFDHKDGVFKSVSRNRGNDGKGTKIEGKSKYTTK